MKIEISNTNVKGQLVIPKRYREELGIDEKVPLSIQVISDTLVIKPIVGVITSKQGNEPFIEILKRTRGGVWEVDEKMEKARRKLELAAAKKAKNAW